jgi:prolyl oligopeptidase
MGKIVRLDVEALAGSSSDLGGDPLLGLLNVVVPEAKDAAIEDFVVTRNRLYMSCLIGGPSRVLVFNATTGEPLEKFPTPEAHVVFGMIPLPKTGSSGDDIYFTSMGYTAPRALQRFCAEDGSVSRTALVQASPVDFDDVEATTVFCESKDGTKVPMTIVRKKALPPGPHPCVLYAYGGYGISMVPAFRASLKVWLDRGGLYVVANIRGGAEYGEQWHLQGNLTQKQNVFDDFLASAEYLIKLGHTSSEKLCIQGGSNGGLLMGAAMVQRPELFRAVVAQVGIFDSLRTELEPNGVFNIPEFGSVKDEEQYRALRAYSPYHNLPAKGLLPSLLLTTGENDGRVASWQSKKFAAALQPLYAALPSERHLVLRISLDTGHGMGTPLQKQVEELADVWSFIAFELGVSCP